MKEKDEFDLVSTENLTIIPWLILKAEATVQTFDKRNKVVELSALRPSVSSGGPRWYSVVVVKSFKELDKRKKELKGKLVVYNQPWINYTQSNEYVKHGASRAAKYEAAAVLIRSPTPFSIYSVHSGQMVYNSSVPKIPAACITVEDAEYFQRIFDRKLTLNITLSIETLTNKENKTSSNIIAEMKGTERPDEYVIVGGHTDSWNNDGALDDGAGFMIAWEALRVLKELDLRPKRTVRLVLWTAEESGSLGSDDYFERHHDISDKLSMILESDQGVFNPRGLRFTGCSLAKDILQEILRVHLTDLNMTEITPGGESSGTKRWIEEKDVPGLELLSDNDKYYYFHHSKGDSVSVLNADEMDRAVILWTTVIQIVANFDSLLPRQSAATFNHVALNVLMAYAMSVLFLMSHMSYLPVCCVDDAMQNEEKLLKNCEEVRK
ncbi:hypothetical protein HELRODRAFT_188057 [Helobdella robusta]|uniref:Carboxypeptidase Q n=1 Tax=Helobdella robusta TaxID=6412 RepID=T1FPL1_HELRO|nr:hypothetical protein HELRODRAFT_188057 [Helobdella robusta]ESO12954.1 hypothetical protein HELRODRAFT_188057 [Helobdella robusta]